VPRDIGRKVKVRLFHRDFKTQGSELLWAEVVGPNEFKLENGPWLIDGYSYEDVVSGVYESTRNYDGERNVPVYRCTGIVRKGPFRTLRAIFETSFPSPKYAPLRAALKAMDVDYENMDDKLVSVWFTKDVDAHKVAHMLHDAGAHVQLADVPD